MSAPTQSIASVVQARASTAITNFEDMAVGMTATFSKTITDADLIMFVGISGDTNPVHLDEDYASGTMFKGRVAHGALTASFISTVLGTKLPGPGSIYIAQTLKFTAPVHVGDTVTARCEVISLIPEKRVVVFKTQCFVRETLVIDGEAQLKLPSGAKKG
jgi:3-hydroxybutyryl-CoA dehydratase